MISPTREPTLLAGLRSHSPAHDDAVAELAAAMNQPIFRLALRITGNSADAEESVQDTILDVLRGVDSFRGNSRLSTWIYRIAIRAAIRVRARHARSTTAGDAFPEPVDPREPSTNAIARENANRLLAAIEQLPVDQRTVLALSAMDQLPQTEIAEILGIPVGTVYSRLHSARQSLQESLQKQG